MLARVILVSMALIVVAAAPVLAVTRTVNVDGTGDFTAIQPAINASASGDTILVADGVYSSIDDRSIDFLGMDLVLLSESDDPSLCIIDAQGASASVFTLGGTESAAAVIRGFTVTGANAAGPGGGFRLESQADGYPAPTIENCIVTGNSAPGGAGIAVIGKAAPRLRDCQFVGNTGGGGLWLGESEWDPAGASLVEDCTFSDNTGDGVAAGGQGYFPYDDFLRFRHCTISGNTGRGIRHDNVYGVVKADTCQIRDNGDWGVTLVAEGEPVGGRRTVTPDDWITLTGCEITGNGSGGVRAYSEFDALIDCIVSDNRGPGFADNSGAFATHVIGCVFEDNDAQGVRLGGYDVEFHGNTVRGNGQYGARVDWGDGAFVDIHDNTIQENTTSGLIVNVRYDYSSNVTVQQNVISGNGGTGVVLMGDPYLQPCMLINNTIAYNTGHGIECQTSVELQIAGTIVAENAGQAINGLFAASTDLHCSDIFGNDLGDWVGGLAPKLGIQGNIAADPMFCDPSGGVFTIHALSTCLDGNHPDAFDCGDIGARSMGCPPPHAGGDWNISMDGDDYFGDGTGGAPFATIQQAIDLAAPGDTLVVAAGTYTGDGNRDLDLGGKNLVIRSATGDPATCIIDCEGAEGDEHRGFVFQGEETRQTEVHGISIVNAWVAGDGAGILCRSAGVDSLPAPRIENCIVSTSTADRGAGIAVVGPSKPLVVGCAFSDNTGDGGAWIGDETLTVGGSLIENCRFENNSGLGLRIDAQDIAGILRLRGGLITGSGSSGVALAAPIAGNPVALSSSTIVANAGHGIEWTGPALLALDASIIAFNGQSALSGFTATPAVTCTDIHGNPGGDWIGDLAGQLGQQGNIAADPLFCGLTTGEFTLLDASPCADGNHPDGADCGAIGAFGVGCLEAPLITMVSDVGNDQGRQVRLRWDASHFDQPGSPTPVLGYGVYRHQGDGQGPPTAREGESRLIPEWDFLTTVPARGDLEYQYVAATLCDSTEAGICWSTFFISAMTEDPFTYFDSEPAMGYSVDNIVPPPPSFFTVTYSSQNELSWHDAEAPDVVWYNIYRGETADFDPSVTNRVAQVAGNAWTDPAGTWGAYYKVSTVDDARNESAYVGPDHVVDAGNATPLATTLVGNAPNPFNPATTIAFTLAGDLPVTLRVYDLAGRLVRNLLDDELLAAGRHEVVWRGRNDGGLAVASGLYLYRLQAGGVVETRRMALIK